MVVTGVVKVVSCAVIVAPGTVLVPPTLYTVVGSLHFVEVLVMYTVGVAILR